MIDIVVSKHYSIFQNSCGVPAFAMEALVYLLAIQQRQELLDRIPAHRFCESEEFANVVRFLVHPLSGLTTGEIVDQNGGFMFDLQIAKEKGKTHEVQQTE
jgi:NAD(P)-dependent dehydrogenase (short-subunit alcohol dehydrogenase family)